MRGMKKGVAIYLVAASTALLLAGCVNNKLRADDQVVPDTMETEVIEQVEQVDVDTEEFENVTTEIPEDTPEGAMVTKPVPTAPDDQADPVTPEESVEAVDSVNPVDTVEPVEPEELAESTVPEQEEVLVVDPNSGNTEQVITSEDLEALRNAKHPDAIYLGDITAELVTGGQYDFNEYDQYDMTVLFFWESFCPDCKVVLPDLVSYCNSKSELINVVGVHMDWTDDAKEAPEICTQYHVNFPVVYTNEEIRSRIGYDVHLIPTIVFMDATGHTISDWWAIDEEGDSFKTALDAVLEVALDRAYN